MDKLQSRERLFAGRHFDREVIILCGMSLAHTTIMRWVQHYTPKFEKRWRRYALAIGRSRRVDETIRQDQRGVVLSLSCRRSSGEDSGLPAEREA